MFNDEALLFRTFTGFVAYADFFATSEEGLSVPIEVPGRVAPALAATGCFIGVDPLLTGPSSLDLVVALVNVFDKSAFPTPRMSSFDFEFERAVVPYTTSLFLDAVL